MCRRQRSRAASARPASASCGRRCTIPAMKHWAAIRGELGIRTIFNLLGPICNPAGVKRQVVGVFSWHWVEPIAHVLNSLGAEHVWVVHGHDGLDELTTTGATDVAELKGGRSTVFEVTPADAGLAPAKLPTSRAATSGTTRLPSARCWRARNAPARHRDFERCRRADRRRQGRQSSRWRRHGRAFNRIRRRPACARKTSGDHQRTGLNASQRKSDRSLQYGGQIDTVNGLKSWTRPACFASDAKSTQERKYTSDPTRDLEIVLVRVHNAASVRSIPLWLKTITKSTIDPRETRRQPAGNALWRHIGRRMQLRRTQLDLSVELVAQKLNVSPRLYEQYEAGESCRHRRCG